MPLLTTARASKSDALGRYYTKADISSFLVNQIDNHEPRRLLDLGVGAGSLSIAAVTRWSNLELLTVDIDVGVKFERNYERNFGLNLKACTHKHIFADALSSELPSILDTSSHPIDTAVCNPPFLVPAWKNSFYEIFEETGFTHCLPQPYTIDAAALFLAQNLRLLGRNASLAIILPDSLVSAAKYKKFRTHLLDNYEVTKAIQLPRGSFHGTDALASIFIIKKSHKCSDVVEIIKLNEDRSVSETMLIDADSGYDRLDYDYHWQKRKSINLSLSTPTLLSSGAIINRGSFSSSQSKLCTLPVFHTSNILPEDYGTWKDLSEFETPSTHELHEKLIIAEPGDILVARVGRNLESKVIGVKKGFIPLTDCVYRIRAPKDLRSGILSALASDGGRTWLSSHAYGVAAKQLTKRDLLSFPITIV